MGQDTAIGWDRRERQGGHGRRAVPELTWMVRPGDEATVVEVSGAVDLATDHDFDQAVRAGLNTVTSVVILDLGKVTFLGSVGLRVLVQAHNEAQQAGRVLRVVEGSVIVQRIIEITGLRQVLSVFPTLEEAKSGPSASPTGAGENRGMPPCGAGDAFS